MTNYLLTVVTIDEISAIGLQVSPSGIWDHSTGQESTIIECGFVIEMNSVKKLSTLSYWKLRYLSKPVGDRCLYQIIASTKPRSIVEFGLTSITRSQNLIRLAQKFSDTTAINYYGIDLFEGRPNHGAELKLKDVHRELNKTGAKTRLMPGDFCSALSRLTTQLGKNDLVIVATSESHESIGKAWYYAPWIMNETGLFMLRANTSAEISYEKLTFADVTRLAERNSNLSRQAA